MEGTSVHQKIIVDRIFSEVSHRPWPLPNSPWVMAQQWHNLLFAHWQVQPELLRQWLPAGIKLDLHEGRAFLGVIPFLMRGVHFRGLPPVPGTSRFPELNVRTYVRHNSKPGVWFFSLDAANSLAVAAARAWFHLPYFHARMNCLEAEGGEVQYSSVRMHYGAALAEFRGSYQANGSAFHAQAGSLEHFLTERYCLFSQNPRGQILVGEIHHLPWSLQPAEARFTMNTMSQQLSIALEGAPTLLFAKRQDVVAWPPRPS
jgi:uncharacterized protein